MAWSQSLNLLDAVGDLGDALAARLLALLLLLAHPSTPGDFAHVRLLELRLNQRVRIRVRHRIHDVTLL